MGTIDRIIRVLVAIVIAVLYFNGKISGTLGIVLLVVAGIFLLTSIFRFCPAYLPLGIKTCKDKA